MRGNWCKRFTRRLKHTHLLIKITYYNHINIYIMKTILQFIINILLFTLYIAWSIIPMILWYGKLPKVSPYHYFQGSFDIIDIFNNKTIQSRMSPDELANKRAIDDFLYNNAKILDYNVSILNEKGKEIGTTSLYTTLRQINNG